MGFAGILKQSTAVDVLIGPFVDSTDGDTEETGLTIAQADVRLSKNGQTAAQKNDNTTCAHDADGFYNCELDATDTNTVGQLTLYVHVAGALCVRHDFQVVEENVFDAWFAASAAAGTDLAAILVDTGTTLQGELDGIQADTEDIQSRLPAALVNSRMDCTIDGTGMEAAAVAAIADGVWDEAATGHTDAGKAGEQLWTDVDAILVDTGTTLDGKIDTIDSNVDAILADTGTDGVVVAAGAKTGYSLAADQSGVTVGTANALGAQAKADVNAEVVDALATDTYAEPGQGTPAATTTLAAKLGYLYKFLRNRVTVSADTISVYNDDATTVGQKSTHADDATTYDRGEFTTGA